MKHCSELLQVYYKFVKIVETQFSKRIKIFQSNNALEYTQYAFQAILHSYGTIHQLTCLGTSQQNGKAKRNLSVSLPNFLLIFGAKLLFMLLIAFSILSSKIKLHMNAFMSHLQTITTFALSVLPVSFFFNRMSITNLSIGLDFVVFLAMEKLKRGIGVMIMSLIVFVSPAMLSFGNIAPLSSSLISVPPYLPPLS